MSDYGYLFPSLYTTNTAIAHNYKILVQQYWGLGLALSLLMPASNAYKIRVALSKELDENKTSTSFFWFVFRKIIPKITVRKLYLTTDDEYHNCYDFSKKYVEIFRRIPILFELYKLLNNFCVTRLLALCNPMRILAKILTFVQFLLDSLIDDIFVRSTQYCKLRRLSTVFQLVGRLVNCCFNIVKILLTIAKNIIDIPLMLVSDCYDFFKNKGQNLGKTLVVLTEDKVIKAASVAKSVPVAIKKQERQISWVSLATNDNHRSQPTVLLPPISRARMIEVWDNEYSEPIKRVNSSIPLIRIILHIPIIADAIVLWINRQHLLAAAVCVVNPFRILIGALTTVQMLTDWVVVKFTQCSNGIGLSLLGRLFNALQTLLNICFNIPKLCLTVIKNIVDSVIFFPVIIYYMAKDRLYSLVRQFSLELEAAPDSITSARRVLAIQHVEALSHLASPPLEVLSFHPLISDPARQVTNIALLITNASDGPTREIDGNTVTNTPALTSKSVLNKLCIFRVDPYVEKIIADDLGRSRPTGPVV